MSLAPHVLVVAGLDGTVDGDEVNLPEATLHHLRRVLRLGDDAALSLTDGAGRRAEGVLMGDVARCVGRVRDVPAPTPRLTLAQALSKGRRAEDAVRAACELGVDRLVPVVASRTQGRPDARGADTLVARWDAVAVAALEQSRGAWRAVVESPATVDALARREPSTLRLVAVPGAPPLPEVLEDLRHGDGGAHDIRSVAPPVAPSAEAVVAVGPEGGWTAEEVALLTGGGWRAVGLGPSVLRTEHAGPVAVAVLAALLGRWAAPVTAGGGSAVAATLLPPPVEEHAPPVSDSL